MDQLTFDLPGYWIDRVDDGCHMVECSVCGARNVVDLYQYEPWPWLFCYRCGKRMENAE